MNKKSEDIFKAYLATIDVANALRFHFVEQHVNTWTMDNINKVLDSTGILYANSTEKQRRAYVTAHIINETRFDDAHLAILQHLLKKME